MAQSPGKTLGKTPATKKSAAPPKPLEAAKKAVAPRKAVSKAAPKAVSAKTASAKESAKTAVKKASPRASSATAKSKGNGEATVAARVAKSARTIGGVTPEQRYRMICDAAYFRAERRGFVGGNAVQDWLDAESEIDELLREMQE